MRFTRSLAVGLVLVTAASGCASGSSLKNAVAELQKDVQRLEADDAFKVPGRKLRILQRPDKDIPCDNDKFKRVLRATADYENKGSDVDSHLDFAHGLMEKMLVQALGYKLDFDFSQTDAEDGRFIYGTKGDPEVKMTVYVAPDAPAWRLHAMTACLSR
ncbi:hypothetical protein [Streptosporangium sp. OZ121]|uniref:hypothetical protein n=1 Tax=Streptosporangium sp. OZ121 TaxID=3444183 RepID=UPI003F7AAA6B